jgi:deoxyribodipyrimidine photo-lyase
MGISLWWVRRDLRLMDDPALESALSEGGVLPVFILDPALLRREAPFRQAFLFDGLRRLDASLRQRGSRLVLRTGQPELELARLLAESGAVCIHAAQDTSPYARRRDEAVARLLPLRLHGGQTVHPPLALRRPEGRPYTVFTPFSRAWKALPFSYHAWHPPAAFPPVPELASEPVPPANGVEGFPAGEVEALRRLEDFLDLRGGQYGEGRNQLDTDGTSALSPYLRFGMLSPKRAAAAALEKMRAAGGAEERKGYETWLNELIWREFYQCILYEFPQVLGSSFHPAYDRIAWRNAPQDLLAWQEGRTGYPVVDAAMRQLRATGWMHNRARMIVASFLAKDLLLDWRQGEAWFMRWLVDGDPAANNGGWQWTAGVGTDAAPYFRVFNPVLQGQKFDPGGAFVRAWLPELARVPESYIHQPWLMPDSLQRSLGVRIGGDYPAPIVEHALAREHVLRAYAAARGSEAAEG